MSDDSSRDARHARLLNVFLGLQARPGQKGQLDHYGKDATAEEPLRQRPRAKAAAEAGKGTAAHQRMSGAMRDGTEDKREYSYK